MSLSVHCHCNCSEPHAPSVGPICDIIEQEPVSISDPSSEWWPRPKDSRERGVQSFFAGPEIPLVGEAMREGEVWHVLHEKDGKTVQPAMLTLYPNGFSIRPENGGSVQEISWSPFSLVQACRLHSVRADVALPWLRLFKVSVFHHGTAHFFAPRSEDADAERARWVADIARGLRQLTLSLFPSFRIRTQPLEGAAWTSTRLLAGYMLMCSNQDVSLVYCELHSHWDCTAAFAVYENERCDTRVMRVSMGLHTCISERVGVDCSCFSIGGHHFTARTSEEKIFWLRAISNVKVKLRHQARNPSQQDLMYFRSSVMEGANSLRAPQSSEKRPLLPQKKLCNPESLASNIGVSTLLNGGASSLKGISKSPAMADREPSNPESQGPDSQVVLEERDADSPLFVEKQIEIEL